ncbi:MAG: DnaB-like helicase C-terminal domain-containing protein, partial [Oscillospiraceae bacterium]|nr:DnaB-like helicase C-terminal domain-containing protein [Oscillospiraceae bacterium]
IDDTAATTPLTMLSSCRQLQIEHQLGLVVIDYMQLMSSQNNRGDNRQQEISDISRSLKLMAKELDVPVIALSQLSRACEARQDKHPVLSDLRDSGSIEQDADSVMFLFRPDYYVQDHLPQEVEEADLVVAKNRSGATGTVKLGWMPSYTLFVDLSRKEAPDDYVGTQAQDFDAPYELE